MFKISANQKQELPLATMFLVRPERKGKFVNDLPYMIPSKFG
jgi:hypothetical protein